MEWEEGGPGGRSNFAFSGVLGGTPRIVFASLVAYLVSSLIDTEIFALWKTHLRGPKWIRVLVSNAISTGADSFLFILIAFYGLMPVWPLIEGQYIVKMAITVLSLPLIYLVKGWKPSGPLLLPGEEGAGPLHLRTR